MLHRSWKLLVILSLAAAEGSFAQSTASVSGRILDSTGAAVPSARIRATNEQTGLTRETISTAVGTFVLDLLPVGTYTVVASAEGFKGYVQKGIHLEVNQRGTLDAVLEIGALQEQITVEATVSRVETQSGTLREVVDSVRVTGLPLNGRDVLQLQLLVPGVIQGGTVDPYGGSRGYSIGGGIVQSNNYFLDGGQFMDSFYNTPQIFPNPDALQEFAIQTNASSAEYGRNRGGIIAAVTKSGTNSFHGTAFEFLRNNQFNARNFFLPSVSPFHQNQFGASLGGPIRHDKLLFFGSWESYRQIGAPSGTTITVLDDRERQGDFSGLGKVIRDPTTGSPFPGNIIPESRLSPATQKFLDLYVPLPNRPNRAYTTALNSGSSRDQIVGKVDWQPTTADHVATRWIQTNQRVVCAAAVKGFCQEGPYPRKSYVVNYARTISPTRVNTFVFTWTRSGFDMKPQVSFCWNALGANIACIPKGHSTASAGITGRFTASTGSDFVDSRDTTGFSDTYGLVRGKHYIKVGGEFYRNSTNEVNRWQSGGVATFSGVFAGDGAADFLLGAVATFRQVSPLSNSLRQNEPSLFVQDDWKATSRLFLNLGLRWNPSLANIDSQDHMAAFRPGRQSQVYPTAIPGMVFFGDPGILRSIIDNRWNHFAPRFGFAWTPTGSDRFAVRGGYGVYFDRIYSMALNRFPLVQPFVIDITLSAVNIMDPFQGQNPFPYQPPTNAAERSQLKFYVPGAFTTFHSNFVTPYAQQWNLNVQWEPVKDYVWTAAYAGSKSTKLFLSHNINPALQQPDATVANTQQRRIYQQYGVIEEEASVGYSQYHSLQLSLNKRFSQGFTLISAYTLSKDLGLTSAQSEGSQGPRNPFNFGLDKGRLSTDVRNRFVNSFKWQLPGRTALTNPVLKHVLAGWALNGIFTLQSGNPFTVSSGVDNSLFGIGSDTADLVGNPFLPTDRPRKDLINEYFNKTAFKSNARFSVGTSGINILTGPGIISLDLGISKEFSMTERHRLQFRSEIFNALNRPNFSNPVASQNSVNLGKILNASDPRVIQFGLKYLF